MSFPLAAAVDGGFASFTAAGYAMLCVSPEFFLPKN